MTNNDLKYYGKLKYKKYRDIENKFLIEGIHLVEECLNSELYKKQIDKIIIRSNFGDKSFLQKFKSNNRGIDIIELEEGKFNKLSETINSQGIIGIIRKSEVNYINDFSLSNQLVVSLDKINDPGNLGTILRTCYWFGVNEVLVSKNSSDIFNSKVLRSSQGAVFYLSIREELNLESELTNYFKNNFRIYVSDSKTNLTIDNINHKSGENILVVFGNEANGISQEILLNKNYTGIKIKEYSGCESLNVAVAAGIILNKFKNG